MIVSNVISIAKPEKLSTIDIEQILEKDYGSVIRWSIVDTNDKELKICIAYEKEV